MTHPIGTSPAFPAFSAVFSAKSMKEGAVMPRIIRRNLIAISSVPERPFMPRDSDKNNDSRGRRDRPGDGKSRAGGGKPGGKGRSGAARGPEKKFAKRGFAGKGEG